MKTASTFNTALSGFEYIYIMEHLFPPVYTLNRADKEKLLNQKGKAIWLTGLSGSGKSTIANALEKELYKKGLLTRILDGDDVRKGINNNLGFSEAERTENIRRIAEITKLFVETGVITICCFISPTYGMRKLAKEIIGEKDYIEVFINAPLDICEKRDPKGVYAKARKGEIKNFTGIDSSYEIPLKPDVEVKTNEDSVEQCVTKIISFINQN